MEKGNLIRDLLYAQMDITDDILSHFPVGNGALGFGLMSFKLSGEPESPTVIVRSLNEKIPRDVDCALFGEVANCCYDLRRDSFKVETEKLVAALELKDESGETFGAAVFAIANGPDLQAIGATEEELFDELREYFSAIVPKVGQFYGHLFDS